MLIFLQRVWALAYPYRARLFIGVAAGVLAGLTGPLLIATIAIVSSIVFQPIDGSAQHINRLPEFLQPWLEKVRIGMGSGLREHWFSVVLLVATIPMVMLLSRTLGYINTYFLQWTAVRAINDLRTKLFSHLLGLSAGFFNQTSSGKLISRIMNDTAALQSIISGATSVIIRDPITLIGILGLMLWRQPMITMISLIVLPTCMIPLVIYSRKVRAASRGMQDNNAALMQVMTESFTGQRVIKAYNLEPIVCEDFRRTAANSISNAMRITRANELSGPIIDFLAAVGVALALLYMIYIAHSNPNPGDFIQLAASIFYMYAPMKNLTRLHNQLNQARAGCEQVFALLATKNSVPEPTQPKMLHASNADIQFHNVHFSYGSKEVLHGINLTVKAGQLVALVGASGSGKTTLSNLLLRFFDPSQGSITIGGVDIRDVITRDLRHQIAVVAHVKYFIQRHHPSEH